MLRKHGYHATLHAATGLNKHGTGAPVEYVPLLTWRGTATKLGPDNSSPAQPVRPAAGSQFAQLMRSKLQHGAGAEESGTGRRWERFGPLHGARSCANRSSAQPKFLLRLQISRAGSSGGVWKGNGERFKAVLGGAAGNHSVLGMTLTYTGATPNFLQQLGILPGQSWRSWGGFWPLIRTPPRLLSCRYGILPGVTSSQPLPPRDRCRKAQSERVGMDRGRSELQRGLGWPRRAGTVFCSAPAHQTEQFAAITVPKR